MRPKTFGGAGGRIPQICSRLSRCRVFADVGCDHGYCAQYMLENDLCDRAIISDISPKSLSKAGRLLGAYIASGRLEAVCCDGLSGVRGADLVLIAGMGGEEIVKILKEGYIPPSFVFQPMKNSEILRSYLLGRGCALDEDDIFMDGKFYFIIKGRSQGGGQDYTPAQLAFGRDSLKNPLIGRYLEGEIQKINSYLSRDMAEESRASLEERLAFLKGVYGGETCRSIQNNRG